MKVLKKISDNEMIAEFLKAEMDSDRWSDKVNKILKSRGIDKKIILHPDLSDDQENILRRETLANFRGYGVDKYLFGSFPINVEWVTAIVTKNELEQVLYIDWDYWTEVTGGSRKPKDFAEQIRNNAAKNQTEIKRIEKIAKLIKAGEKLPKMIFVGKDATSKLVVLEGHVRLTAYFLHPNSIPDQLEVIAGFSENISDWEQY